MVSIELQTRHNSGIKLTVCLEDIAYKVTIEFILKRFLVLDICYIFYIVINKFYLASAYQYSMWLCGIDEKLWCFILKCYYYAWIMSQSVKRYLQWWRWGVVQLVIGIEQLNRFINRGYSKLLKFVSKSWVFMIDSSIYTHTL